MKYMNVKTLQFKLFYIPGLRDVVFEEVKQHSKLRIKDESRGDSSYEDAFYVEYIDDFDAIKNLRSVAWSYLMYRDSKYNPRYISNHKSILGNLVEFFIGKIEHETFNTFKIYCAGSDSPEVVGIEKYLEEHFRLKKSDDADLNIYIVKIDDIWELGLQITPQPLSLRGYRVRHMKGAINQTVAYALNYFCDLKNTHSYLNAFSGSGTLLIEAAQCFPDLDKLVGFDNDKNHLSLSIQNIKNAGLIEKIQIFESDIYNNPDLGKFDAITADLPFGMSISKDQNLNILYERFIAYCEKTLNVTGRLVVYTSEDKILEEIILKSNFRIIKTLRLEFMTRGNQYLHPKIFVCEF